jgi:hypothetical protein
MQRACPLNNSACRTSLGEAVTKASVPGADIGAIMTTLEAKYRMVLEAFNNTELYRKLYQTGMKYTPAAVRATKSKGINFWKRGESAGEGSEGSTCTAQQQ